MWDKCYFSMLDYLFLQHFSEIIRISTCFEIIWAFQYLNLYYCWLLFKILLWWYFVKILSYEYSVKCSSLVFSFLCTAFYGWKYVEIVTYSRRRMNNNSGNTEAIFSAPNNNMNVECVVWFVHLIHHLALLFCLFSVQNISRKGVWNLSSILQQTLMQPKMELL